MNKWKNFLFFKNFQSIRCIKNIFSFFILIFIILDISNVDIISSNYKLDEYKIYSDSFEWVILIHFCETNGQNDLLVMSEAPDANDGPPNDFYDTSKSTPGPGLPYIYSWFDDNLTSPFDKLFNDCRKYPDTYKIWNLTVIWLTSDNYPTNITIYWNPNDFTNTEYNSVWLSDTYENPLIDMKTNTQYTFLCPNNISQEFKIICSIGQGPIAFDDYVIINEDSYNNELNVLENDYIPDGFEINITETTFPSHGFISVYNNYIYYTPNLDYYGYDQFNYTISNNFRTITNATVFININPTADYPVAVNDSFIVFEDSSNNQLNVLLNDFDVDGDDLVIDSITMPSHGSVSFDDDFVYYTPDLDYFGTDEFTYTIFDGAGLYDNASVNIMVNGFNDDPIAEDDYFSVYEDSFDNLFDIIYNDYDVENQSLTITYIGNPSNGSYYTDGYYLYYTPNQNYYGYDMINYTISDGFGGEDSAIIYITIIGMPDYPVAVDDILSVDEDSGINLIDVLFNDFDVDGDDLVIDYVTMPSHGFVSFDDDFVYYTPDSDYFGTDNFNYTVFDGTGLYDTATVNITINNIPDNPIAEDDIVFVEENSVENKIDVLINDYDFDGDEIEIQSLTQPNHGVVTYNSDYVYYTPDTNYFGTDNFTYTITDVTGLNDTAIVNITITHQIPDLFCSGILSWDEVIPGDTVNGNITVENIGDLNSLLDWEIESYPEWGSWSFDPESGTDLAEGESLNILVEVIAPDVEKETFSGEVRLVNIENPDDICTIDVSLKTPVKINSYLQKYKPNIL